MMICFMHFLLQIQSRKIFDKKNVDLTEEQKDNRREQPLTDTIARMRAEE